jgi:hypothetical protein
MASKLELMDFKGKIHKDNSFKETESLNEFLKFKRSTPSSDFLEIKKSQTSKKNWKY